MFRVAVASIHTHTIVAYSSHIISVRIQRGGCETTLPSWLLRALFQPIDVSRCQEIWPRNSLRTQMRDWYRLKWKSWKRNSWRIWYPFQAQSTRRKSIKVGQSPWGILNHWRNWALGPSEKYGWAQYIYPSRWRTSCIQRINRVHFSPFVTYSTESRSFPYCCLQKVLRHDMEDPNSKPDEGPNAIFAAKMIRIRRPLDSDDIKVKSGRRENTEETRNETDTTEDEEMAKDEAQLVMSLRHKHIVNCFSRIWFTQNLPTSNHFSRLSATALSRINTISSLCTSMRRAGMYGIDWTFPPRDCQERKPEA